MAKYTLDDWLIVHGFTSTSMTELLGIAPNFLPTVVEASFSEVPFGEVPVEQATAWIKDSLSAYFFMDRPNFGKLLEGVEICTQEDGMEYPCVTFEGTGHAPIVFCDYDGNPEDILNLAHECGHAIQFIAAQQEFIPPIWREAAAFLAEFILVDYLQGKFDSIHGQLKNVVEADHHTHLREDLAALSSAIKSPGGAYYYRANYPPARILALQILTQMSKPNSLAVYEFVDSPLQRVMP